MTIQVGQPPVTRGFWGNGKEVVFEGGDITMR